MTQKELLYLEDAYEHENIIVKLCNEIINNLESDDLVSFIEKEIKKHNSMKDKIISLMEELSNE